MIDNCKQFLWKIWLRINNPSCTIKAASISRNVKLENKVTLEYGSHVQASFIGKYTYINKYCLIDKSTLSIGRFCSIAYGAKIGLGSHPINWVSSHAFAYDKKYRFLNNKIEIDGTDVKTTIIGNDVWIGANAIVLAGVKVGDGAVIGANSLVNEDVEPYSIMVGSPARHLRFRFNEEQRKGLLEIKWWNWDEGTILNRINDFNDAEKLLKK